MNRGRYELFLFYLGNFNKEGEEMVRRLKDVTVQSDQDRVILLIRHLNIKQYQLAKELGYSKVYFESVINGRAPFTDSFRKRIDNFLAIREKETKKE